MIRAFKIFIFPKIKSFKVLDLAKAINPKAKIKIIGIRPGEKIHEDLITTSDSLNTYENKDYYIIYPPGYSKTVKNKNYKKVKTDFNYNSGKNLFMTISELKKKISKIDLI